VHQVAKRLCRELEDVIFALDATSAAISIGSVERARPDGRRDIFVFPEPIVVRATAFSPTVTVGSGLSESPEDRALRLHLAHPELARAQRFLRGEPDWPAMYKAFELARAAAGGKREMATRGWATANQQARFTHTADSLTAAGDSARHAVERTNPPKNPMTVREAQDFVIRLIRDWSNSLS